MYSGTVGAAVEGVLQGIPSIAVSVEYSDEMDYRAAADYTSSLARRVLDQGLPPDIVLNLNFPTEWNGKVLLTRQGPREGKAFVVENADGHGDEYTWLRQELHPGTGIGGSHLPIDADVLHRGFASLTPLHLDRTSYRSIKPLSGWTDLIEPAVSGE
jgi:5'-nucleotidase